MSVARLQCGQFSVSAEGQTMTAMGVRRLFFVLVSALALPVSLVSHAQAADQKAARPLKALLLASGGYHDYAQLAPFLTTKLSEMINVKFDVDTDESLSRLKNKNFARDYDVIVY